MKCGSADVGATDHSVSSAQMCICAYVPACVCAGMSATQEAVMKQLQCITPCVG